MQLALIVTVLALVNALAAYCAIRNLEKDYLNGDKLFSSSMNYYLLIASIVMIGCISVCFVAKNSVSYIALTKLLGAYIFISMAGIYDYKTRKIPNYIPISMFCFGIVILGIESFLMKELSPYLISSLIGSLASMTVLYVASKLSKGGVGFGDVKLFGAIGFCVGMYAVFTVMTLAIVLCALAAVPILIMKKKTIRGDLPFAPFIYLAYVITLILSLY